MDSSGVIPVRLFVPKVMYDRLVSWDMVLGITPVREFESNVTYTSPRRFPNEGFSGPAIDLRLRVRATTMLLVHKTPVKAQAVPWVHCSELGLFHELYIASKATRSVAGDPAAAERERGEGRE